MGRKSQYHFTVPVLLPPAVLKGLLGRLSTTHTVLPTHTPPLDYSPELTRGIAEPRWPRPSAERPTSGQGWGWGTPSVACLSVPKYHSYLMQPCNSPLIGRCLIPNTAGKEFWLCEPNRSHRAVYKPYCETQSGVAVAMKGLQRERLIRKTLRCSSRRVANNPQKGGGMT